MSEVCDDDQTRVVEPSTSQDSTLSDTPEQVVEDAGSDVAMEDEEVCINVNPNRSVNVLVNRSTRLQRYKLSIS